MVSTYSLEDYKTTYFEHKVLDKVHGHPTMDDLLTLFLQFKQNTQCVPCTLGGGQLGYLGLILTPEAYSQSHNAEEFICPSNPRLFCLTIDSTNPAPKCTWSQTTSTQGETDNPNVVYTHADIAQKKATHDKAMWLYLECQAVKQSLQVQLIEAIGSIYFDTLQNSDKNMIHKQLTDIMDHLMKNYG